MATAVTVPQSPAGGRLSPSSRRISPAVPSTDQTQTAQEVGATSGDPLYERLIAEAHRAKQSEPAISCLLNRTVLHPGVTSFNQAVAAAISHRLGSLCGTSPDICPEAVRDIINEAMESDERVLGWTMAEAVREDVLACVDRDPACLTILEPLLFFVSATVDFLFYLMTWLAAMNQAHVVIRSVVRIRGLQSISLFLDDETILNG